MPGMDKALSLIPAPYKLGVVEHDYNPSRQRQEDREFKGHPWLHVEFETSLKYIR